MTSTTMTQGEKADFRAWLRDLGDVQLSDVAAYYRNDPARFEMIGDEALRRRREA